MSDGRIGSAFFQLGLARRCIVAVLYLLLLIRIQKYGRFGSNLTSNGGNLDNVTSHGVRFVREVRFFEGENVFIRYRAYVRITDKIPELSN